jgi:putative oxygen-independent coproporphyrinogen III oxidase
MGQRQALAPLVTSGELYPLTTRGQALGPLADAAPGTVSLGFYLHVPFCSARCHYCSFNTAALDRAAMARYLGALAQEIDLLAEAPWAGDIQIDTIFFGGGTPSLLAVEEMATIMARLRQSFRVGAAAEVTVECNPESVEVGKLAAYRQAGVNRISLGVQSLDDTMLERLGRLHSAHGARRAYDATREAGFDNVSIDLMYGLPGLEVDRWKQVVRMIFEWAPEHLSAYGLTLDAGSRWGAQGVAGLPPEETVVAQYWALAQAAAAHGYEHYEISNYARPSFRARHNLVYWRAAEYLAAGPGACGFVGDIRYANAKPVARYCSALEARRLPIESSERLTSRQRLAERLILGLRTSDGVPAEWLRARAQDDRTLERRLQDWQSARLILDVGDRVRLSESAFLLSDSLFTELL